MWAQHQIGGIVVRQHQWSAGLCWRGTAAQYRSGNDTSEHINETGSRVHQLCERASRAQLFGASVERIMKVNLLSKTLIKFFDCQVYVQGGRSRINAINVQLLGTVRCQSVCPSVRPSVCHTPVLRRNGYRYHQLISTAGTASSHTILFHAKPKRYGNTATGSQLTGRRMWRCEKSRFSTNVSLYLRNDTI